jgi:hypothetical protein
VAPRTLSDVIYSLDERFTSSFKKTQFEYLTCRRDDAGVIHCLESYWEQTPQSTCSIAADLYTQTLAHPRPRLKRKPSHPREGRFGPLLVTQTFTVAAFMTGPVCPDCLGGSALRVILAAASRRAEFTDATYKLDLAWRTTRALGEVSATSGDLVSPKRYVALATRLDKLYTEYEVAQPIASPWLRNLRDELRASRATLTSHINATPDLRGLRQRRLSDQVRKALTPSDWSNSPLEFDETPVVLAFSYLSSPFVTKTLADQLTIEFAVAGSPRVFAMPRYCADYLLTQLPSSALPPDPGRYRYGYTTPKKPSDRLAVIPRVLPGTDPVHVLEVAAALFDPHGRNELSDFGSALAVARAAATPIPAPTTHPTQTKKVTK